MTNHGNTTATTAPTTLRYRTAYRLAGATARKYLTVQVTEGYSTLADIPKIIAVREFSTNDADAVARITILSLDLVGDSREA